MDYIENTLVMSFSVLALVMWLGFCCTEFLFKSAKEQEHDSATAQGHRVDLAWRLQERHDRMGVHTL